MKSLLAAAAAAAVILFAAVPGQCKSWTTELSYDVTESTSNFDHPDNKFIQSIELLNTTTGYVTYTIKESSADYASVCVPPADSKTVVINEKMTAFVIYLDTTHGLSTTIPYTAIDNFRVTMSSVNHVGYKKIYLP